MVHFFKKIQDWILKSQGIRENGFCVFLLYRSIKDIFDGDLVRLIQEELVLIKDELSIPFMFSLASVSITS